MQLKQLVYRGFIGVILVFLLVGCQSFGGTTKAAPTSGQGDIRFLSKGLTLVFKGDGRILKNGNLIETDQDLVNALREFLASARVERGQLK